MTTEPELDAEIARLLKMVRRQGYIAGYKAGWDASLEAQIHCLREVTYADLHGDDNGDIPEEDGHPTPPVPAEAPAPAVEAPKPAPQIVAPAPPAAAKPTPIPPPEKEGGDIAPDRLPQGKKALPDETGRIPLAGNALALYEYLQDLADEREPLPVTRSSATKAAGIPVGSTQYFWSTLETRGWITPLDRDLDWGVRLHDGRELWSVHEAPPVPKSAPVETVAEYHTPPVPEEDDSEEVEIGPVPPRRAYSRPDFDAPPDIPANGERHEVRGVFSAPMKRRCAGCQDIFECKKVDQRFCGACQRFVVNDGAPA